MSEPIPLIDLQAQRRRIDAGVRAAMERVLAHGRFIMGPEVEAVERRLADYTGAAHVVTCASGTEALTMVLRAWGVGPGDAVLVPAFTFVATAEAAALVGATPVFAEVRADTFNLDAGGLDAAAGTARAAGFRPRAVIPVDLFGQPADYAALLPAARAHGLLVLADAAQSVGARLDERRVGTFGGATATSFFPSKPLGCYGDGGAVFTDDEACAGVLRSLRIHGQGRSQYDNVRIGVNGRFDTLQAAILLEKLTIFDEELAARQRIAGRYSEGLRDVAEVPRVMPGARSAWAQYTLRVRDRDRLLEHLRSLGIAAAVYYPAPVHRQPAYAGYPRAPGELPVAEALCAEVISLPMHPYLEPAAQDRVIAAIRAFYGH